MRVCLVSPPALGSLSAFPSVAAAERRLAEKSGLGALALAAVLERAGVACELHQLSRHLFQIGPQDPGADLAALLAGRVAASEFDVLGVSTICSSYPFLLRFAGEVKRRRPDCTVVLGGPQASATDVATLNAFPQVDFVVRGEADETFPRLLECLSERSRLPLVPGISYRDGGRVVRTADAPPVLDLDALPLPAYHLLPTLGRARWLPFEIGRGCPFSCTFCSTNDYFRRRFRLKSDAVAIAQMIELESRFHVRQFTLTHDMFTVDRRRVLSFCRALLDSGRRFRWACSARTDCVDEELLRCMHEAGCVGLFFGIESGSERIQALIRKNLDLDGARRILRWCDRHSISVNAAAILGFPEEEERDVRATLEFLFDAESQRHVAAQTSYLAPLAGTALHAAYRDRLAPDADASDLSDQGFPQSPADLRLIAAHPDIFPNFYLLPTRLPRRRLQELECWVMWAFLRCRWLAVALCRDLDDPWLLWKRWLAFRKPVRRRRGLAEYYSSARFYADFARFAESIAGSAESRVLASVHSRGAELEAAPTPGRPPRRTIDVEDCPVVPRHIALFRVAADPREVVDALVSGRPLAGRRHAPATLYWKRGQGGSRLFRLPAPTAHLLSLCNGKRPAYAIAAAMASRFGGPSAKLDPVVGWIVALEHLRRRGLVEPGSAVASPRRRSGDAVTRAATGRGGLRSPRSTSGNRTG